MTIILYLIIAFFVFVFYFKNKKPRKYSLIENNIINENVEDDIGALYKRAHEKYLVKDFNNAIAICDKILDLHPNYYDTLVIRAMSLEQLNYNLDAIDDYEKALSIRDEGGNVFGLLGLAYDKIGNFEKSLINLKIAVSKGMNQYQYYFDLFNSSSIELKQKHFERSQNMNMLRRNKLDFIDDLSETNPKEIKDAVTIGIKNLEQSIQLDPENKMLNEMYIRLKKEYNL